MRGANRNKQLFWYALYSGKEPTYDEYGNENGWNVIYTNPEMERGNISPGTGEAVAQLFGYDDTYDHMIGPLPIDTPIDEYAVLWIDCEPNLAQDGSLALNGNGRPETPYDHIVRRVARSLPKFGGTMLGVQKVTVT